MKSKNYYVFLLYFKTIDLNLLSTINTSDDNILVKIDERTKKL